jgi:hypothetical protein
MLHVALKSDVTLYPRQGLQPSMGMPPLQPLAPQQVQHRGPCLFTHTVGFNLERTDTFEPSEHVSHVP